MMKWLPHMFYAGYTIITQKRREQSETHGADGNPLILALFGPIAFKLLSGAIILIIVSFAYLFWGTFQDKFVYFSWLLGMMLIGLLVLSIIQLIFKYRTLKKVRDDLNKDYLRGR